MTAKEFAQLLLSLPDQDVEFVGVTNAGILEVSGLLLVLTDEGYVATPDYCGCLARMEAKGKC